MSENQRQAAVIAGGSAGVGREVARRLAEAGYAVAVLARGEERLAEAGGELAGDAPEVLTISCDVADASAVEAAAERVEADLGPIAVWVNSAMMTSFSPFGDVEPAEFERIVATTLTGTANGMRAALKRMCPRGRGRVVNVGSGLGYRSVPLQGAYCASKHGIVGLTASVRSELLHEGSAVTVSMIQLPAINTPQFDWARNRLEEKPQPAPPIYDPAVAAEAVMRAVKTGQRELLVGKSVLQLVLGNLLFPDLLDRKLATSGVTAQKSGEPEPGGREDNLFEPAERDVAARGRFDDRAKRRGTTVDGDTARYALLAGLVVVPLVLGVGIATALHSLI